MANPLGARSDFRDRIVQGLQLEQQRRFDEAVRIYDGVLQADPANFYALYRSAVVQAERGNNAEALRLIQAAMQENVTPEIAGDQGVILERLGKHAEALESYARSLQLRPGDPAMLLKQATLLMNIGRYADALASLDQLLVRIPNHAPAHGLRGTALVNLARHQEALPALDRAITLDPNNADAHFHRALTLLTLGDFEAGWKAYERRFLVKGLDASRSVLPHPHWNGTEPLEGKSLLLYTEQGLGDSIMFARYAPILASQGIKVILGVLPAAKPLMTEMEGTTVVAPGDTMSQFDRQAPLLSLPYLLKTRIDTIPANVPYLRARPDRTEAWRTRLPLGEKPMVGVVWAGGRDFKGDRARSIALQQFATLFDTPGIRFVSLQRDLREGDADLLRDRPELLNLGHDLADFADTAAVISLLDAVVSVDTAVAHLAGAMAKPVSILLPKVPDFRWMLDRSDSPWYPTARLFRQPAIGDWDSVLANVRTALAALAEGQAV